MAAFEFKALDSQGREMKGVLEGDNARQVRQQLREKEWLPVSVEAVLTKKKASETTFTFKRSIKAAELSLLTRQLASLVQSGMPLENCLNAVAEQSEKPRIKSMLMEVRSGVLEGHTLANSLAKFPEVFSGLFRSTVAAGEHSGHLDTVLERLAEYTEQRQNMREKIQLALLYPSILTLLSVLIVAGLLTYVVPTVVKVFSETGQTLPWMTEWLIAMSDFVREYGLYMVIAIVAGFVIAKLLLKQTHTRLAFDAFLLKVPLFAKVIRGVDTSRFCRTLSILKGSGVPLLDALKISTEVMTNKALKSSVKDATTKVREGTSLHVALKDTGRFPPLAIHMIASGEAGGDLEAMLHRVAENQDREFERLVATLLGLVGPLLVVLMGGVVLFIVLAILLPIFELNQLVV